MTPRVEVMLIQVYKPKPKAKPKQSKPGKAVEPLIESWRPAGGERPKKRGKAAQLVKQPTKTLGLARVSTWQVSSFQQVAEELITKHGGFERFTTEEVVHGGESVTDIFVVLRSETVAEMVKDKIDGEIVAGRKIQVQFSAQRCDADKP
jgi:hypothetical protein